MLTLLTQTRGSVTLPHMVPLWGHDRKLAEGKVDRRVPRDMAAKRPQRCLDDAVKSRAMRLGGGSLLVRRGRFATPAEWRARREGHNDRLKRIDQWLSEHAGGASS